MGSDALSPPLMRWELLAGGGWNPAGWAPGLSVSGRRRPRVRSMDGDSIIAVSTDCARSSSSSSCIVSALDVAAGGCGGWSSAMPAALRALAFDLQAAGCDAWRS